MRFDWLMDQHLEYGNGDRVAVLFRGIRYSGFVLGVYNVFIAVYVRRVSRFVNTKNIMDFPNICVRIICTSIILLTSDFSCLCFANFIAHLEILLP